jgi:hypothetical protein
VGWKAGKGRVITMSAEVLEQTIALEQIKIEAWEERLDATEQVAALA